VIFFWQGYLKLGDREGVINDDDFEKLKRELIFERVSKAIEKDPKNWTSQLEDLGFQWFDDEDDQEEVEEELAKPENVNQEFLVGYFEGYINLSDQVLYSFFAEKNSSTPNYPLIRKYFKKGNENLRRLLIYGLEKTPTDIDLLNDLGFFSEFRNILGDLIQFYLKACKEEKDMSKFEELVRDFYYYTEPDGFDALYEIEHQIPPESDKRKIIEKTRQELELESESIKF
jgi:hypothetical protein